MKLEFVSLILALMPVDTGFASPDLGAKPVSVILSGDHGGRVDGTPWNSEMIRGKVWAIFYVDPDRKDDNEPLEVALKAENLYLSSAHRGRDGRPKRLTTSTY